MPLKMWTLDIAREQSPDLDHLRQFCELTAKAGYDAIGLYLEHRFAYPSLPWMHGRQIIQPNWISQLESEFPNIQIIPFINLLGHFEGMLYTEEGKHFAEEKFKGLQACPSNPEFISVCESMLMDTIEAFQSEIIHIGGDETAQLGVCPQCKTKSDHFDAEGRDGKAVLYGNHFGPLAHRVLDAGRRPAIWGDILLAHPGVAEFLPKETLVFDWQYFGGCLESTAKIQSLGFDVVGCPTLHTYNSVWCHLPQSAENLLRVKADIEELNGTGVCLTTWECGLMGSYETMLPAIHTAGRLLNEPTQPSSDIDLMLEIPSANPFNDDYRELGENAEDWAKLMGAELQKCGGSFKFSGIRSSLKVRLLLNANPFLAWLYHHEEFCGEIGDRALVTLEQAIACAPNAGYRGVSEFVKLSIEFVRFAEDARRAYRQNQPGVAASTLAPCRQIFEHLERIATATHQRIGGSRADIERCRIARAHVETVIRRIKEFGDGSLGYLPAFEILTHPKFVPHDQACWWLINKWANE